MKIDWNFWLALVEMLLLGLAVNVGLMAVCLFLYYGYLVTR